MPTTASPIGILISRTLVVAENSRDHNECGDERNDDRQRPMAHNSPFGERTTIVRSVRYVSVTALARSVPQSHPLR